MPKKQEQWEEDAIERFRVFLGGERSQSYAITGREVVTNSATGGNFDYQLQNEVGAQIAVEIFRLVEDGGIEFAKQKVWGKVVEYLKKELLSRGIKGYLISTPEFAIKKKEIPAYSLRLADEIEKAIKDNSQSEKFKNAGFEFHKMESIETVVFSSHGDVRSINPHGTATAGFADKLPKKNEQVAVADHERILLVVSWAMFVNGEDTIRALSDFDFSPFQNVDKIFFEQREKEFALVYDRSVVEAIKHKQSVKGTASFQLMLQYARYQLGEKKQEAFDFVKSVTTSTGDISWLADNAAKENLVMFGEKLLEKDLIEDAMWIVRQLHNDENPKADGMNDVDDPEGRHNYHAQVLRGEDVSIITTVRGHLCWLMMKIVAKNQPQYYTEIIDIMVRYFKEDNLYIRTHASYILAELWRRRRAKRTTEGNDFTWKDEERLLIRKLALDTVRVNSSHPRVMESLLHVFDTVRDLNEDEAEEILQLFIGTEDDDILHDLAAYVVYFALFRDQDSPHYGGMFKADRFITLLKSQIQNGKSSMRSSLAWHLWKILTDNILPYNVLKEYFLLFLEGKYSYQAVSMLSLVFEELARIAPEDAMSFYERAAEFLEAYLKTKPVERQQYHFDNTERMIPLFAKEPARLVSIVRRLKNIWLTEGQIYIGNIATIFSSYQLVPLESKDDVRKELKAIYDEMKAVWQSLQEVDWTK